MTFVCLSIPPSATGADSGVELGGRLLAVAPRLAIARDGLVWADARGLDAHALAGALLATLVEAGLTPVRAGVAATPVAAQVAVATMEASLHGIEAITVVPPRSDRAFLAAHPLMVLQPLPVLQPLLAGLGIISCGDLAGLDQDAVEARLGRDGVLLWHLTRADDPRLIFGRTPRALPEASLEWTDYSLTGGEPLFFVINALLGTVCEALQARGEGACALTLEFALTGGGAASETLRSVRPTADRPAWRRQLRRLLERITLHDTVVGATLRVEATAPPPDHQGDLFDAGFGTMAAVEQVLARVTDEEPDAVVTLDVSAHPMMERRARWRVREEVIVPRRAPSDPALTLQLLPDLCEVEVRTERRGGFAVPAAYRDAKGAWDLAQALGPDCISGGYWESRYAREYYQCVRQDGQMVLLCRDALAERWVLSGWWV